MHAMWGIVLDCELRTLGEVITGLKTCLRRQSEKKPHFVWKRVRPEQSESRKKANANAARAIVVEVVGRFVVSPQRKASELVQVEMSFFEILVADFFLSCQKQDNFRFPWFHAG